MRKNVLTATTLILMNVIAVAIAPQYAWCEQKRTSAVHDKSGGDVDSTVTVTANSARANRFEFADITTGSEVQAIDIQVTGTYEPSSIEVEQNVPVLLRLHRKSDGKCAEEFEIPDYKIKVKLPPFETTEIVFLPAKTGKIGFQCGMNMMKGHMNVVAPGAKTPMRQ